MAKEKVHPLIRQYPQFFSVNKPGDTLIGGDFNTYEGWNGILAVMLWRLAQLPLPESFRLSQIKEKFGRLRVYHNREVGEAGQQVERIIASAEKVSGTICEYCGAPSAKMDDSKTWLKTLCPECKAERK